MALEIPLTARRGLVATCVGIGGVDADYSQALLEMALWNASHGFDSVEYARFPTVLVEHGRDAVAAHALSQGYDWVLQIDADAAPFAPDALARLLRDAYELAPEADAIGAYCQLKHPPYLPTIDTGTGRWEEHYPGEGLLEVIRTGGHFLLTKTSAYRKIRERLDTEAYHRTRMAPRPIDLLRELDNFARVHCDGRNPFAELDAWERLSEVALESAGGNPSAVGEDSSFCDNLRAAGGTIFVDTDLVAGHVARTNITPQMLKSAMQSREAALRAACGVTR